MAVTKKLEKYYEGLYGDDRPTGVPDQTIYKCIDTGGTEITYDGGTTWVVADKRVRLVGEDGSFLALDEQLDDLLNNIAVLDHHSHSRIRVYPQDVGATITLAAAAAANTFGSWTEIIPINIIDFLYHLVGLNIEAANAAQSYLIQLGYSILTGSDPTTAQIIGEQRIVLPTPVSKALEHLDFLADYCPANAKLWGRIKSDSVAAADELEVSVDITRHMGITNPITLLTTWPWNS